MNSQDLLIKEFEDLKQHPISIDGYTIELFNQTNIYEWKITLLGAKDTPYSDGIFLIKLEFPKEYPIRAPKINFLTPICHMNVCRSNGRVGVNFIDRWKSKTSVREILTKLYSIFYLVNPDSPFERDLAELYKKDPNLYFLHVKKYTHQYAKKDNENININFIINGERNKYCINCNSNMDIYHLIDKIQGMIGFYLNNPLFIYESKKLNEHSTLGESGLKNESFVTIIDDVHY